MLRDHGFEPAVQALAEQVGLERGCKVDVEVAPGEALAERAQVTFYQLIREALNQAADRAPSRSRSRSPTTTTAAPPHGRRRRAPRAPRDGIEAFEERARPLSGPVEVERTEAGTTVRSSPRVRGAS